MAAKKKKPTSSADFRKAEEANQVALVKWQKTLPKVTAPKTGDMGGTGPADVAGIGRVGGGGGKGGGMTATDLELRKLRETQRQFNLGRQDAAADAARRQGGMDTYLAGIQQMIDAGSQRNPLLDTLNNLATQAQGTVGSSYDALKQSLQSLGTNPFAGYQAQAVSSPTAGLEQFLSSQGVGTDDLTRFAQLQQAQSAQQAQAANNLMAQLGGIFAGGQQSRLAEAEMGRAAGLGNVDLNRMLLESQLGQQDQDKLEKLRQLMLQGQMQRASL